MIGSTHIAMTKAVLDAIEWPGDRNLAARNAAWPDSARVIEVEKYGAHVIGRNLASLTHFVRPLGDGKFGGYCWGSDKSVPKIDISKVKVIPKPDEWGAPLTGQPDLLSTEPFSVLVEDLVRLHGSIQADEITYSTAAIMGEWVGKCYWTLAHRLDGALKSTALSMLLGWIEHLVAQDPAVCYHANGCLLDGHTAFEGDVDETYKRMEGSGEIGELLRTLVKADNIPSPVELGGPTWLRVLAEDVATRSYISPKRLCVYRWFWRRGWNKATKECVLRGLTASVQVAKVLKRVGWEAHA